ncbi:MAG: hypothetical protein U0452_04055 [Anaerolineae bacterium]
MAPHEITITIRKLEDLFIDSPDVNPLCPDWEADSGLQRVALFLKTRRLYKGVHVTVRHPDTLEIPLDGQDWLQRAIDRYCDARIAENASEREFKIQTGLSGLAYGLVVVVLLSRTLNWVLSVLPLDGGPEYSLVGLVEIATWAIVWGPMAAIFFDWLPNWTAIRVYRTIKRGQFEFKPIRIEDTQTTFQTAKGGEALRYIPEN